MADEKILRSILLIGPYHSGKSIFGYLLFRSLRLLDNNACLMDADYFSPTFRRADRGPIESSEESLHLYYASTTRKMHNLDPEQYCNHFDSVYDTIDHDGCIVIDGLGKHSECTEYLIRHANNVIIVCRNNYDLDVDSKECNYIDDSVCKHPFDFYREVSDNTLYFKTHLGGLQRAIFTNHSDIGELYDLDRDVVHEGDVSQIPAESIEVIENVSRYILDNWMQ